MARRELLLLRHAKSAWDTPAPSDFERPLAPRGLRDAPRIARWLRERELLPDLVLCSSAQRARATLAPLLPALAAGTPVRYEEALYLAAADTLAVRLRSCDDTYRRVLLCGHNPGLDELLLYLSESAPRRTAAGKLMTTAALAHLRLGGAWSDLGAGAARLLTLQRARALSGA